MGKQTVVFDFDGVISTYENGWEGAHVINDKPVEGIKKAMLQIRKEYKIVILSSRCSTENGRKVLIDWLNKYEIPYDSVTNVKPQALAYIDDRAICFRGDATSLYKEIKRLEPWNNKFNDTVKYIPQPNDIVQFVLFDENDLHEGEVLYEYKIINHQNPEFNDSYFYCLRSKFKTYNVPFKNIKKKIR